MTSAPRRRTITAPATFFVAAFRWVARLCARHACRPSRHRLWATLMAASSIFFSVPALAATVTLTADRDNTLFQDATGALSNGSGPYAFAGNNGNGSKRRAVVHFALGSIPVGATITGATLTMVVSMSSDPPP